MRFRDTEKLPVDESGERFVLALHVAVVALLHLHSLRRVLFGLGKCVILQDTSALFIYLL